MMYDNPNVLEAYYIEWRNDIYYDNLCRDAIKCIIPLISLLAPKSFSKPKEILSKITLKL